MFHSCNDVVRMKEEIYNIYLDIIKCLKGIRHFVEIFEKEAMDSLYG